MAYPPAVLPTNRTNATAQADTHPADHNQVNAAVNDTVAELNRRPKGVVFRSQADPGVAFDTTSTAVLEVNAGSLPAGRLYRIEYQCNILNSSVNTTSVTATGKLATANSTTYPTFTDLPGTLRDAYARGSHGSQFYTFGFIVPSTTSSLIVRAYMLTTPAAPSSVTAGLRVIVVTDEGASP